MKGNASETASAGGSAPAPPRGGVLRVGIAGASSTDVLDPHNGFSAAVYPRTFNLFDLPGYRDPNTYEPEFQLVEHAEPNTAGDEWVVRLRPGVEFHNGKTLDADDLIFTVNRILDPSAPTLIAGSLQFMGINRLRKEDDRTVRFFFDRPFAPFVDALFNPYAGIVPVGFDPGNPVGTGPFRYKSFTSAEQSVFERFENYWGEGGPYVDTLVLVDIVDDERRVDALLDGDVDAIDAVPASQIDRLRDRSGFSLLTAETGNLRMLTMRVDTAPFGDARVRQAMRLIADRQEIGERAYAGEARVAGDVFSPYDPCFRAELTRERDIEQARFLLKEAGHDDLRVELTTSAIAGGLPEVCRVYAEQAKAAGVTVAVREVEPSEFYSRHYGRAPFAVQWWPTYPYVNIAGQAHLPRRAFNVTHFDDAEYNDLFARAVSKRDGPTRCRLIGEMQRIDFERGGNIVWGFVNTVDAHADKVVGFHSDSNGWHLGSYTFKDVYFA